ncbi:MAG: nucleoside hydrolase [Chloroflexi bacterium]|nr:nucleoside hydrolase [Chloroflexota bacterium]
MISLILDTDIGDDVDDAFALAFAARHPQIRLCAVTTVLGDTRWRAALTLRLLDELGIEGITLSGDVVLPPGSADPRCDPRPATDLMADAIAAAPEPVWLATIGPATNAAALLAARPRSLDRLSGIVMMGGRHDPSNPREHNFGADPAAAAAVCNCGRRVRVGDYLVTSQAQLRRDDLARVRRAPGIGRSLGLMLETYLGRRGRDWTSMYDPAALTLALGEEFLRLGLTPRRAEVVAGQVRFRVASAATHLRIAAAIDAGAFRRGLLDVLGLRE